MSKKTLTLKPIAAVAGVAFVSSMVLTGTALAADNPFEAADLESGYLLAGDEHDGEEGKCGEGKCGEEGEGEGKCGEGKCGEEGEGEEDDGDG